jgi:hypothetical protein
MAQDHSWRAGVGRGSLFCIRLHCLIRIDSGITIQNSLPAVG